MCDIMQENECDINIQGENILKQETEMEQDSREQYTNEEDERPYKRVRDKSECEEDEWEWTVQKKEKRVKIGTDKPEVYVSHKEKLPKQFGLAKLFKENDINGVSRIKYLNPYKIRIDFDCELNAEKFLKCDSFDKMGWNFKKTMEVSHSYGIIRPVDLDLTEEQVLANITYEGPGQLLSVRRLNRRGKAEESNWVPSECVRLCFKGSYLPTHISVDGLKISVERYIFPVSQCSRCWKLGHFYKTCPSTKIVCPKCGKNHASCDTQVYICINCKGNHMALSKVCPMFTKERRIREIMAEFNCTYKKAREVYVPLDSDVHGKDQSPLRLPNYDKINVSNIFSLLDTDPESEIPLTQKTPLYSEILKTKAIIHNEPKQFSHSKKDINIREHVSTSSDLPTKQERELKNKQYIQRFLTDEEEESMTNRKEDEQKEKVTFSELLVKLKNIILSRRMSCGDKISGVIKCCVEWLILVAVGNISEWPVVRLVFDCLANFYG